MIRVQDNLRVALSEVLDTLAPGHGLPVAFEKPKLAAHGDLAITAAMQLARPLKQNPRALAQQLLDALQAHPAFKRWVYSIEIAGPGFLNLRLTAGAKQEVVREVLDAGSAFGQRPPTAQQVLVEFVSANPTGPLHVGHGRQAALGDAICNLLASQGHQVYREFYYNDAGVQIQTLATSVQCRAQAIKPGDADWPEAAYNGDYIADIAADFLAQKPCKPMTVNSPPAATSTISTACVNLPWRICAASKIWTCKPLKSASTTITWNPVCTPAAGSSRRCKNWWPPARPTS